MTSDPSCQLNQHLKDSLVQQLLQLDEVSILGPGASPVGEGEAEEGDGERDLEQQVGPEGEGWVMGGDKLEMITSDFHFLFY